MNDTDDLNLALEQVLADPAFVRSPVLARLLRYLVAETNAGRGFAIKSYAVAVEGLGRPADFDAHTDSYARVHVARLRRSLDNFYAGAGRGLPMQLQVPPGGYGVRLVPRTPDIASGDAPDLTPVGARARWWTLWGHPAKLGPHLQRLLLPGAVVVLALIAVGGVMLFRAEAAAQRWAHNDFPNIAIIAPSTHKGEAVSAEVRQSFLLAMIEAFNLMEGINIVDRITDKTDYVVEIGMHPVADATHLSVMLINRTQDRIIASRHLVALDQGQRGAFDQPRIARAFAFELGQATGAIHADQQRLKISTDSPYRCWLAFANRWQQQRFVGGAQLQECSNDWHDAQPNEPLAAMVRGWTLVDMALTSNDKAKRSEYLDAASILAQRNLQLNPDRLSSLLLAMHAACFVEGDSEFDMIAAQLLSRFGDMPDVRGSVGLHMLYRGNLKGRALLQQAVKGHFNPPPRFFVGLFFAAVRLDDVAAARTALASIPSSGRDPQFVVLSAALAAREGRLAMARAAWTRATQAQRARGQSVEQLLDEVMYPPGVKERLRIWLSPVWH